MDYDELVTKVIELLQREKRVPYRALKRRFDLDDDYIEDLKVDLIEAKRLAIDENDRILVWIGDTQEVVSQPSPPTPQPAAQAQHSPQVTLPPTVPPAPEAERRQLTVMFCDLVDSTRLSSQLDPEDYREVVRAYQAACTEVIQRYDGHIAQYLGDGLLVYFGYPVAHEEDVQRAIHTGLGIIQTIQTLNTRLEQTKGIKLAIRLGVHTGLVVVGDMGGTGRQEQLALGETPNIAARIQGLADPNTIVISNATYRLVQGYFEFQELGEQVLRGVSQPIPVYCALGDRGIQSRLDVVSTRGLTPLVGREQEVGLLIERWEQAKEGQGQVILLSGEAGIGKSRLVHVLKDHLADEPHTRWECRSSPYYQNTALYPLIDLLQRTLQWRQEDAAEQRLEKLEQTLSQYRLPLDETIPLFAPLLSLPLPEDRYPPLNFSPQRQRQKTLESIVAILLELAERQPMLFILEDLHWTDPTTLEFLGLLVEQVPTASIYALLTCRPHFQPSWHHRSYLTESTVNRLSSNHIERIAEQVAGGKRLPGEVLQQIVGKTDGVPLFVEEMTKAVVESGVLKEANDHFELIGSLTSLAIPATLQDSLMARLDRLMTAKVIAQLGATIGRQFSYELLESVTQLDTVTLQRELARLVEAELLYQLGLPPQATYTFKHALIQDAAYQSLLKRTRQHYHQTIAHILAERFVETADNQPELLAYHLTEAGLVEQAVALWSKAGAQASERSAYVEAIAHLRKGLELLPLLPVTAARDRHELLLQCSLAASLTATKSYTAPEVGHTYTRAYQLCQQIGETPELFAVLAGMLRFYVNRGEVQKGREVGEEFLRRAQHQNDAALVQQAHFFLGFALSSLGEFSCARAHCEQSIACYAPQPLTTQSSRDAAGTQIACLSIMVPVLWSLGYPDQALARIHDALRLAHHLAHPFTLAVVLHFAARLHQYRREVLATQAQAQSVMALAHEQGFPTWVTCGKMSLGWTLVMQGRAEEGIAQMRQCLTSRPEERDLSDVLLYQSQITEAYKAAGRAKEGLPILAEALATVANTGMRHREAELYWLQGDLLLSHSSDNASEAASCFHQAIAIAQSQQAKSWELRAATSLARLWQRQGKHQEAYDLLAPVYGWFTEGFDTADLMDAKALLDELR